MALLDVNMLVALAWDSHVHHAAARHWFGANASTGWATCPITETGFVRVSANRNALPYPVNVDAARLVLAAFRAHRDHRFLTDDVSIVDEDVPSVAGYRQVTDAHLLTLARRHGLRLVTFDAGISALAGGEHVELLTAL